jgi:hypothetical protein
MSVKTEQIVLERSTFKGEPIFQFVWRNQETEWVKRFNLTLFGKAAGVVFTNWDGQVERVHNFGKKGWGEICLDDFAPIDKGCIGMWAFDKTGTIIFGIVRYADDAGFPPYFCTVSTSYALHCGVNVPTEAWRAQTQTE